jgi:26S proteasome regulatory subunit N8
LGCFVILQDGTTTSKTFVHTPSIIEAEEAEEIGVEHLLRDIRDVAVGTLSTRITNQLQSLQGLHLRLRDIQAYLEKVLSGQLPANHAILGNLQDVFNLLPNLTTPTSGPAANGAKGDSELSTAMSIKTNDQLMAIYLSSLIRAITAFHDLIENKIQNRQQQEEKDAAKKEGENGAKEGEKKESTPASAVNGETKEGGGDKEKEASKEKKK